MWAKITNCTTTTGGGRTPIRKRVNQNISVHINPEIIDRIGKEIFSFVVNGREYITTFESKIIIKKL